MTIWQSLTSPASYVLDRIQRLLALEFLETTVQKRHDDEGDSPKTAKQEDDETVYVYKHPQFATNHTVGRAGLLGCLLGTIWGIHVTGMGMLLHVMATTTTENRSEICGFSAVSLQMLTSWYFYIAALSIFHLLEFFITCLYNPTQASCESFLINHSKAYTAAILVASTEFWTRFWLHPSSSTWQLIGALVVVTAQCIRTLAMATCGESFHHFIQTKKRDNHILIKEGIYHYLRHPSYVGFFYYSIGTQVALGNVFSTLAFGLAGWAFFSKRIPYEERSLIKHFGYEEYYMYAQATYMGIPFISARGLDKPEEEEGIEQVWTKVDGSDADGTTQDGDSAVGKKTQ